LIKLAIRDDVSTWVSCPNGSNETSSSSSSPPTAAGAPDTAVGQQLAFRTQVDKDDDGPSECARDWAVPVHDLNCEYVFPPEYDPKAPLIELDTPEYYGRVREAKVFEMLLAKAGIRLAAILNMILADPDEIDAKGYVRDWTVEAEAYRQSFPYGWFGSV
jgi:hypothetical protein